MKWKKKNLIQIRNIIWKVHKAINISLDVVLMNLFSQIGYVWENKRGGRERRMHLSSVCSK